MEACSEKYCSLASLAAGEDPIGTATSAQLLLVLEVPLPWEREIWRSPGFPPGLFDLCAQHMTRLGLRVLCIAPDADYSRSDRRRLMILRRPAGPCAVYDREEYLLPPDELLPLVEALVGGASPARFAPWRQAVEGARDLLVCTHGTVDVACAKFGIPVYEQLRKRYAPVVPGLRVWRVSHFGGHRFAPTLIDLPDLRYWAHLDSQALDLLVHRKEPPSSLHRFYRGWGLLASPFEQVLEREALEREGWEWLSYQKESRLLQAAEDGTSARVSLSFRSPDGRQAGCYEAEVVVSHHVNTVMVSGKGPEPAPQYRITSLLRR
ncbi:MAG: sucrase ferredoxin [Bacillota bacterium]